MECHGAASCTGEDSSWILPVSSMMEQQLPELTLTQISYYPVKSTAGIDTGQADVGPRGLKDDRRWMLVDSHGRFLTAREHPQLLQIQAGISDRGLTLSAPGMPMLDLSEARPDSGPRLEVTIWHDQVNAAAMPATADAWCSDYLGLACRLVYMDERCERSTDPEFSLNCDIVSFADGFPCLLISEASLEDLNTRTPMAVGMRRFRPNLVISGCRAYAEDGWRRLRIGTVEFAAVKPCARCVLTTIDPRTSEKHAQREPLRTLGSYRRRANRGIDFGQNLIPRGAGTLRVGDRIEIL